MVKKKSKFDILATKIQKTGKSKESANAIAASIGFKKFWKKKMIAKAVAGRKKAAPKKVVVVKKKTVKKK